MCHISFIIITKILEVHAHVYTHTHITEDSKHTDEYQTKDDSKKGGRNNQPENNNIADSPYPLMP
jgi:hypothetical protein